MQIVALILRITVPAIAVFGAIFFFVGYNTFSQSSEEIRTEAEKIWKNTDLSIEDRQENISFVAVRQSIPFFLMIGGIFGLLAAGLGGFERGFDAAVLLIISIIGPAVLLSQGEGNLWATLIEDEPSMDNLMLPMVLYGLGAMVAVGQDILRLVESSGTKKKKRRRSRDEGEY